jgi:K+-transporting ATPase ATPase B chain
MQQLSLRILDLFQILLAPFLTDNHIHSAFASTYPLLTTLNFMHLATPESAILSAVIFNALIIIALIPLALRGVPYRSVGAAQLLRDNLLIYGVGGLIAPFVGIKLIDMILVALHLT